MWASNTGRLDVELLLVVLAILCYTAIVITMIKNRK